MALNLDDLDSPMATFDFGYLLAEKWVKGWTKNSKFE